MVSIFRIRPQLDDFKSLAADEADIRRLVQQDAFKGQPIADWWKPIRVWAQESYEDDRPRVLGDFANFISGCLIMSHRAADALHEFLRSSGEFLELDTDLPLVAWNCTNVIGALDPLRTKGVKYAGSEGFMRVSRYALRGDKVDGHHIFKVPERVASDLFISDAIARLVEDEGLLGLRPEPVELT